ncbi:glutamate synthase [NADPH] isoform X2 [Brachionus plicatilis]|uniref:glutamate synthase (NADH) n=1 Tax=Brachionus plicatilis TaxID=10195 RepID=A0A3M7SHQ6_BRAPC|nr:glutamate synthase [NADPH] isoform X2 [Brachionus plicatilis]
MKLNKQSGLPEPTGLYDPSYEKDACGVGFIVNIEGIASHQVILDAKKMLTRMAHRGACGCDDNTGDGAGVMTTMPDSLFRSELLESGVQLPASGEYAVAVIFMPRENPRQAQIEFEKMALSYNLKVVYWRTVPVDSQSIGEVAREHEPLIKQAFVIDQNSGSHSRHRLNFHQRIFIVRKRTTHIYNQNCINGYICSFSTSTLVYKGLVTPEQLWDYFLDFKAPSYQVYLALVHSRFSTNTFPSWERAHPYRYVAHNGEINTLRGNVNYMNAREGIMTSKEFGDELNNLFPVVEQNLSDSGCLDNVVEFLVECGERSLPEAMLTMVPEAWQGDELMSDLKKAYYKWNSCTMEPWDGPALLTFTDGRYIGAILDRNGLRPSRYYVLKSKHLVMASEVGVIDVDDSEVVQKGRLKPGRMLLADVLKKQITSDIEIKNEVTMLRPVQNWVRKLTTIKDLHEIYRSQNPNFEEIMSTSMVARSNLPGQKEYVLVEEDRRLPLFGYNVEVLSLLLLPMIKNSKESLGSMGNDAPLACLSQYNPLIYDYFKQLFAQVTNPPIDPIREKIIMSLACPIGPESNILEPSAEQCERLFVEQPILSLEDLFVLKNIQYRNFKAFTINIVFDVKDYIPNEDFISKALNTICKEAVDAANKGYTYLILSDRMAGRNYLPISPLLAVGAVHHYLIEKKLRKKVALLVETGEAREIHHLCLLLGFGADAICPFLVFETIRNLNSQSLLNTEFDNERIFANYTTATKYGIAKVMAKMGISTLQSYKGAQIFEAVGIHGQVISRCFKGTSSRIGGVDFRLLSTEAYNRYLLAYGPRDGGDDRLAVNPGTYHWRNSGERHINDPGTIASLQQAAQKNSHHAYKQFSQLHTEANRNCTIRGQFQVDYAKAVAVALDEVEPAAEIVKRFATGAMSFGSISIETHQTLARAMNKIKGKSNTGEGGENTERLLDEDGADGSISTRSAIKQVASGRFGVSSVYLSHADDIQIKMAQGAKPGEGGELPGYKVTQDIANCRNSIPGVGLISPPPHHDIYSIEDLAELIYDLKCANPKARISVKLVSEVGVGVVASGVVKAKAEHLTISGHDGGTGASSWTGIKSAGLPWELGLAETHQTLVLNDLRSRVVIQADGQLRTGLDIAMAAMLGADEFGFATAPLITLGCIMMRKCHLNTCPVGIATQDPVLREKFVGKPEHLGVRKFSELVGRVDFLKPKHNDANYKEASLNYDAILLNASSLRPSASIRGGTVKQNFELEKRLEEKVMADCMDVIEARAKSISLQYTISNVERAFGASLSNLISLRYKDKGLQDNSIHLKLKGSAGQSFGAFLAKGITMELAGDANDYVGKGLSGGKIVIYPPVQSEFKSVDAIIVGNVVLYGAIRGTLYIRGQAAERFCVRNSGAVAVSEGCGDHGCEYMTGGVAVILGLTGRNFAAGMSGGIAYIYDPTGVFPPKCNKESVSLYKVVEDQDLVYLKSILGQFCEATGSLVAKGILDNWPLSTASFIKVFPNEYKKVLESGKKESVAVEPVAEKKKAIVDIEDSAGKADKLKGFYKYERNMDQYRKVDERLADWKEIHNHQGVRKHLKTQAARCMDCGIPFCQSKDGCPLGNIIPKWNDLVYNNNWKEALYQLLQTNNFPEFTGRVCPAPCEGACVLGINAKPVTIKNIECAIIDHAFEQGWMKPEFPKHRTGKRIAVIGSGPAGLAAAHQLNRVGHLVTVFERNNAIGGLLRYGIPSMKLSKDVVQRRVDLMTQEGIEFRPNVEVGKDVDSAHLLQQYDAVLVSTGATWPRDLNIPGRHLNGIYFAMSFLQSWQEQQGAKNKNLDELKLLAKGKRVLVIGGGDTGVDCIGTSLRQGAKDIITFEILPKPPSARAGDNPWPTWPKVFKLDYGHEETMHLFNKDPRVYQISSKEFIDDGNGNVAGVRTVQIEWKKDESGRWQMAEVAGSETVFECDLVLLAMGFLGPEETVIKQLDLKKDPRSNISTPESKYSTSVAKVYAAGDCRRGQSLVVWAIHEGRQAARQIDQDLMGYSSLAGPAGVLQTQKSIQF